MNDSLFLIGGSGSSGTTLVGTVLDGLRDLRSGPETWLFHQRSMFQADDFRRELYRLLVHGGSDIGLMAGKLKVPLHPSGLFRNRDFYGLDSPEAEYGWFLESESFSAMVAGIKRRTAVHHGWDGEFAWLDQTPKNAIAAREILWAVPQSRFVHVLRDGRDVVTSLVKRWTASAPGHPRQIYLLGAAASWAWDVSQALRARNHPGYLELRYEDFVARPLEQVNRVLAHLGREPVDQATLDAPRPHRAVSAAEHMRWGDKSVWKSTPDRPINTDSVGRWERSLEPELLRALMDLRFEIAEDGRVYHFGEVMEAACYA